jgi:hypothetical protein
MAGTTTANSDVIEGLPGGLDFDTRIMPDNEELSVQAAKENLFLERISEMLQPVNGMKRASYVHDRELTLESGVLNDFGHFTMARSSDSRDPVRLEFTFDNFYGALTRGQLQEIENQEGAGKIRDNAKVAFMRKEEAIKNALNDRIATGSGATKVVGGASGAYLYGWQTLISSTPTSGNYGGVARTNSFLTNEYYDMDTGAAFSTDPITRVRTLIGQCVKTINKKKRGPDFGLTTQATLDLMQAGIVSETNTEIRLTGDGSGINPDKAPELRRRPRIGIPVGGLVVEYDDSITSTSKKLWLLERKSWKLFSRFGSMLNQRSFTVPGTVLPATTSMWYASLLLFCEEPSIQGYGYYA